MTPARNGDTKMSGKLAATITFYRGKDACQAATQYALHPTGLSMKRLGNIIRTTGDEQATREFVGFWRKQISLASYAPVMRRDRA